MKIIRGRLRKYCLSVVACDISGMVRYFDSVVQWRPLSHDCGTMREELNSSNKWTTSNLEDLRRAQHNPAARVAVLLNGNLNYSLDVYALLSELATVMNRNARVVVVCYNPYLSWLFKICSRLGLRTQSNPVVFVTLPDLHSLARVSGFEVVGIRPAVYIPARLLGIGQLLNAILPVVPVVKWLAVSAWVVLRPIKVSDSAPSLSIVIPARNERGNIERCVSTLPVFPTDDVEVLFVEGHSSDGTWEEIERVASQYAGPLSIRAFKQEGKGKADAVRLGFSRATKDVLVILDADLAVRPEELPRYYRAYQAGIGDFVNGSRLMYPFEGQAMRFLNWIGNVFFARALSFVLGVRLGDSLCGTKLLARHDYARFWRWREDFGEFDPFGDFELLFPAASIGVGIVNIPVRYRERTYGTTNISRFYHGWILLKMTLIGFLRLKLGRVPREKS